jgi:hypothetical protein
VEDTSGNGVPVADGQHGGWGGSGIGSAQRRWCEGHAAREGGARDDADRLLTELGGLAVA